MKDILVPMAEKIADEVIYGERQEQNVVSEIDIQKEWHCFIDEINSGNGLSAGAAHSVTFRTVFAFVRAVDLEGSAVVNDETMMLAKAKCISMLNAIIGSGLFDSVRTWAIEKVREREFDVNVIGWRVTLDLTPLEFSGVC